MKNKKWVLLRLLVCISCPILFNSCITAGQAKGDNGPGPAPAPVISKDKADKGPAPALVRSKDGEALRFDEFIVSNNAWRKTEVKDYSQYIYKVSEDASFPVGWSWSWPCGSAKVKAYPEIIYGWKPWSGNPTTSDVPASVKDITELTVRYDIESSAEGVYNLAFDIWIASEEIPRPSNITQEIMIWLDHKGIGPAGTFVETGTIDGEEYDVYRGSVDTGEWTYVAFIKRVPEYKGETGLDHFLDYLLKKDLILKDSYLAAVEFGNEIVSGTGKTHLKDYRISIRKNE